MRKRVPKHMRLVILPSAVVYADSKHIPFMNKKAIRKRDIHLQNNYKGVDEHGNECPLYCLFN